MAVWGGMLIATRRVRGLAAVVWTLSFLAGLFLLAVFSHYRVMGVVDAELRLELDRFAGRHAQVEAAFAALQAEATGAPCQAGFQQQMRRIAYRPDGLNEFFYAPGGMIRCSVNAGAFAVPIALGAPDFRTAAPDAASYWVDRDLGFAGLSGLTGTIALREPFAVVVPRPDAPAALLHGLAVETVLVDETGRAWHRGGETGLYAQALSAVPGGWWLPPFGDGRIMQVRCAADGAHCLASELSVLSLLADRSGAVVIVVALAGFVASALARHAARIARRYWSFEARFVRHLDADSILCAYQPILDVSTGSVVGCEVLARWRDLDGSVVAPDRFLPVVEARGLGMALTALVVGRAFADLGQLRADHRFQVNFNVSPRDLDDPRLLPLLQPFADGGRFMVAVEIVESEAIDLVAARPAIDRLRKAGIGVYIDDFGAGYSSLHNLAALAIDGVKIDRSFAMAPPGTLMSDMLGHAIAMAAAAGGRVVVEGIETAERLAQLRADAGRVDHAQGYHISRPLDVERLAAFLRLQRPAEAAASPRRVAA